MKCPRCQQENPAGQKFCGECGTSLARASQARPYADLRDEDEGLRRSLTESLEQQTATSEILRVISQSPTDAQPIFDAIVRNASRLCGGEYAIVTRYDGERLHLAAQHNPRPGTADETAGLFPQLPRRDSNTLSARALFDAAVVHFPDVETEELEPLVREAYRRIGLRAAVAVPMVHEGHPIGVLSVSRGTPGPFSDRQIALLQTFADQAVIAIENARLFEELESRNKDLTESLEEQTATGDILKVISQSQIDVEPVFNAIAGSALRLCRAKQANVFLLSGGLIHLAAVVGTDVEGTEAVRRNFPQAPGQASTTGRAILTRRSVIIPDVLQDPELVAEPRYTEMIRAAAFRSTMSIPMLRAGEPIGAVTVTRAEAGPFSDKQLALLQTFADQAVIAIENVRLFKELQEKNRALTVAHTQVTESLEQQTATSEILRVIASSPTDVRPVFEAILKRAATLCEAQLGHLWLYEGGEQFRLGASYGSRPDHLQWLQQGLHRFGRPFFRESGPWRVGQVLDVRDTEPYRRGEPVWIRTADHEGMRTLLAVPLVKDGRLVGSIAVYRREVQPFTDQQTALVQTFAEQAVIAIENVRLFKELQTKNRELTTALDQQTATSEILRAISSSLTDVQPVFNTIVESGLRLLGGYSATMMLLRDDDRLDLVAYTSTSDEADSSLVDAFPMPLRRLPPGERAIHERRARAVEDVESAPDATDVMRETGRARGWRSNLFVPMIRDDVAVGLISITRREPGPFAADQIALLEIFAAQAVIAIENVRLFNELRASNRELTTALDTQTATSDILRVISRSQTDVQPVFDAIVASAVRLCNARWGAVFRYDGALVHIAAHHNFSEEQQAAMALQYPMTPTAAHISGRAILTGATAQIPDIALDAQYGSALATQYGYRSLLAVPILRAGAPIGVIVIYRREPGPFADQHIDLLQTFADQAVIAIENARLLTELQARTQELTRSVDQLTALGDVGRAVSSSLDLETVLTTIVSRAVELSGLDGGVVFEYDEVPEEFVQRAQTETGGALADARRTNRIRKGEGVLGRTAITLESVQVPDITVAGAYAGRLRENLIESGIRAILAVPMIYEGRLIGCLGVTRNHPGDFPSGTMELLNTFATQSALAIQNARLFREIEEKSRQLEVASQHKSEFLANMSHELRTPLNAIIGFSEVLGERMFGELNDKQEEYLKDIYASGQHLLSLINDILDLSKIEAGRMELELTNFNLPATLDNALTLVRERAGRRGIALGLTVDERPEQIRADERKVRQVVLNLLSNAIKFTPEGGRIEVRAGPVDGMVEISVTDTGVGIAPEDQEAIFEEFRQVGTAAKKVEGTGLGLALSRKFVELHGGRIWVESQPGVGSTFTFTIPMRP